MGVAELIQKPDTEIALAKLDRVDALLTAARNKARSLDSDFVEIGLAMLDVKQTKAWDGQYMSWDQYVKHCREVFGCGRSTLYGYVRTVEELPEMSKENLMNMGISKAYPLAAFVSSTGKKPSQKLITAALDEEVTSKQFRSLVSQATFGTPEPDTTWFQMDGFPVTGEEKREIDRTLAVARQVIFLPENSSEHTLSKAIYLAMCAEFLSSYEPNIQKLDKGE